MAKKRGGLGLENMGAGKNALFRLKPLADVKEDQPEPDGSEQAQPESIQQVPEQPAKPKRKKVRTTVTLYYDTFALLEALKVYSRKHGMKATFSDILDAAIRDLAEKHEVRV